MDHIICCIDLCIKSCPMKHYNNTCPKPTFLTYLIVLVEPEKGEVRDADGLPMVLDLLARAVDDVGHFVRHDEFQVLHHTHRVITSLK